MKLDNIYLEASRNGYSPAQVGSTMTVTDLIEFLTENFEPTQKIYISNDNGYTFGPIHEDSFREAAEDEDDE